MIDNLGDILLKEACTLVKGEDVACGEAVLHGEHDLSPDELGLSAAGAGPWPISRST